MSFSRSLSVLLALAVALLATVPAHAALEAQAQPLPSRSAWAADVRTALAGDAAIGRPSADTWLKRQVNQRTESQTLAMNLDIDNTSLASYYAWPRPVDRVLKLAQTYEPRGVRILFNTGRYDDELGDVKRKLTAAGYRWTEVCGRQHGESIVDSKNRCRREFVDAGYTLAINIGNNPTDYAGTRNFGKKYALPNYDGRLG